MGPQSWLEVCCYLKTRFGSKRSFLAQSYFSSRDFYCLFFLTELLLNQRYAAILERDLVQSGWTMSTVRGQSRTSPSVVTGGGADITVTTQRMQELSAIVSDVAV